MEEELVNKAELKENKCKDFCFKLFMIICSIVLLIPSIAFLVLSILSFDSECKIYFILVYIFQGFFLISMIIIVIITNTGCGDEDDYDDYKDNRHHPLFSTRFILLSFVSLIGICIYLGLEIATLIYFIKSYSKLKLLAKIGYFMHCSYYLIGLIFTLFKSLIC